MSPKFLDYFSSRKVSMNRSSTTWFRVLAVFLCAMFCAAGAVRLHAQQKATAVITGTVVDPVGSVVQNATVVVRNESSGVESRATTDQAGKFSIPNLPVGNYTVEVSAPGFALASRFGVKVS